MEIETKIGKFFETKEEFYKIWESALGKIWPVSKQVFKDIVFSEKSINIVAKEGKNIVGFLSAQSHKSKLSIVCIAVAENCQRRGVGSKLVKCLQNLGKTEDYKKIYLGSGGQSYFWPGVPVNLKSAVNFFQKMGWTYSDTCVDMIGKLREYKTPVGVYEKIDKLGIKLKFVKKDQLDNLLKFEKSNFPEWYDYYVKTINSGKLNNILLAVSSNGQILGSVLIDNNKNIWSKKLGNKVGAIGALGVCEEARNQGIGLGLVAKATEILKKRGIEICFLGWTWLVDWYGKLGYEVWQEYKIANKKC